MAGKVDLKKMRGQLEAVLGVVDELVGLQTTKEEWEADLDRMKAQAQALQDEHARLEREVGDKKTLATQDDDRRAKSYAAAEQGIQARLDALLAQERAVESQIATLRAELDKAQEERRREEMAKVAGINRLRDEEAEAVRKLEQAKNRLEQFKKTLVEAP